MENLNLEKFNPTKAELTKLADEYKDLEIKGVDDKDGYLAVDIARKTLKQISSKLRITGKELRSEAIAFQKAVLAKEKDLIKIIDPIKEDLEDKQKAIDDKKEALKREAFLPERKEKLEKIKVDITNDQINSMDETEFDSFYNEKNSEYLEEKAVKIQADADKLEQEKRDKKLKEEAEEEARIKAIKDIKLAKLKADEDKQKAIQKVKDDAEKEKQDLIDAQKKKDDDRIAKDKADKEAEKERLAEIARKSREDDRIIKEEQAEAERQKQLAPDKDKLLDWAERINKLEMPKGLSEESKMIVNEIQKKLIDLAQEIINKTRKL